MSTEGEAKRSAWLRGNWRRQARRALQYRVDERLEARVAQQCIAAGAVLFIDHGEAVQRRRDVDRVERARMLAHECCGRGWQASV